MKEQFMKKAIELSMENIDYGGGPFGAVIVKDNVIISTGANRVTANNDPTAHAEICAIRNACNKLETYDLSGCDIYTSCEPCPMCLAAIYWAHIDNIYYGCNKNDAAEAGFDDSYIYKEIALKPEHREKNMFKLLPEEAAKAFEKWMKTETKTKY